MMEDAEGVERACSKDTVLMSSANNKVLGSITLLFFPDKSEGGWLAEQRHAPEHLAQHRSVPAFRTTSMGPLGLKAVIPSTRINVSSADFFSASQMAEPHSC